MGLIFCTQTSRGTPARWNKVPSISSGSSDQPSKYTSRFRFFAVSNGRPFVLHHFSWAGHPKGQQTAIKKEDSITLPLIGSRIIQSVPIWMASSPSEHGARETKPTECALLSLFLRSSLQTKFNRRKINPVRRVGGGKSGLFSQVFVFCFSVFCFFGSETQDFPNQVK